MDEITNRTKRVVAELALLVCIICFWVVKSEAFDMDDVKAGFLKQAVKADSDNIEAYRFLAGYYMDSGSHKEAAEALRQVVKIEPHNAYAYIMLGDAYWNCHRYEDAIVAYKQAIKLHVENPHIHYQLALVYLKIGDKDSAIEEYEILKSLDNELADELLGLIHK